MFDTLAPASALLATARAERAAADAAEARLLLLALEWAELHPASSVEDCATFADCPVPVAGPGAPLVAEFCIAEFAAAIGLSTDTGKAYVGEAVELAHRLPRTWVRVRSGDLVAWRARRIATRTVGLSAEAAAFVDAQVSAYAHRIGPAALERLVDEAITRFMPAEAQSRWERAQDGRHVSVHSHQVSFEGTVRVDAELDLADAVDLDTALITGAATLLTLGSTDSIDVRRSVALGDLARRQLALDLSSDEPSASAREVVLHVHVSEEALRPTTRIQLARVDNTRSFVPVEQIRSWCGQSFTRVTVKPVVDTTARIHVNAYEVPDRLVEQTVERDHTCAFPWCNRLARTSDIDHVVAWADGGPTATENLAPLCRRHHRLKTHHPGWTYTVIEPGCYLWSSPHGYQFLRDHTGTRDVSGQSGSKHERQRFARPASRPSAWLQRTPRALHGACALCDCCSCGDSDGSRSGS